jgi:hypothetical protein
MQQLITVLLLVAKIPLKYSLNTAQHVSGIFLPIMQQQPLVLP